ncbi:MAG: RES domain-containing protein [Deltaproteobacteria bacterium]|nr:MAG: RES domain-containing protein [Deltaproteobacteria bacterium]
MSPSIWTRCAGRSEIRRLAGRFRRVVEAQFRNSTRKLVDSDDEQRALEELLDVKAKLPVPAGFEGLHYLLYTPFRHPPLRHGSRFGTRGERGILYAARELPTVFAEVGYYRLVFLEGTAAPLSPIQVELTAFSYGSGWRCARPECRRACTSPRGRAGARRTLPCSRTCSGHRGRSTKSGGRARPRATASSSARNGWSEKKRPMRTSAGSSS